MHGILDNQLVIDDLLGSSAKEGGMSYKDFKETNYNKLADLLRGCLDFDKMYKQISLQND